MRYFSLARRIEQTFALPLHNLRTFNPLFNPALCTIGTRRSLLRTKPPNSKSMSSVSSVLSASSTVTISSINERSAATIDSSSSTSSSSRKHTLSTFLHASYGIDHYPGYLLKWNLPELKNFENLLLQQLQLVQDTYRIVEQREEHLRSYTPLYVYSKSTILEWINKDLYTIVATFPSLSSTQKIGKIMRVITEEAPGVYSFPLLSKEGCQRILQEVEHFAEWEYQQSLLASSSDTTNNSSSSSSLITNFGSNRRNIPLHACGFDILQDLLFQYIVQPLYTVLYPELANTDSSSGAATTNNNNLDYRYGYIIGYADKLTALTQLSSRSSSSVTNDDTATTTTTTDNGLRSLLTRNSLRKHTDDSEVTLNISLGKEFSGGDLILKGLRNSSDSENITIHPEIGKAILHLGQHIHEVTPVTNGERYNLIMWSRSSAYRDITCPCCMIHRRTECICDNSWT